MRSHRRRGIQFVGGCWDGRTEDVQVPYPFRLCVPDIPRRSIWLWDRRPIRRPSSYVLARDDAGDPYYLA